MLSNERPLAYRKVDSVILQLNPPIPVETPKGKGQATLLIDYSIEHHLYWVVFLDESRECWTFSNPEIRSQPNYTAGRRDFPPLKNENPPFPAALRS